MEKTKNNLFIDCKSIVLAKGQTITKTRNGVYLFSYNTPISTIQNGVLYLNANNISIYNTIKGDDVQGKAWKISTTTTKYLYKFINLYLHTLTSARVKDEIESHGANRKTIEKLIKDGLIIEISNNNNMEV